MSNINLFIQKLIHNNLDHENKLKLISLLESVSNFQHDLNTINSNS